jgi:integrase
MRGVLDYAEVNSNPASIKIKRGVKKKVTRFRPEQRDGLIKVLDTLDNSQVSYYFVLLMGCGLRPSVGKALH